MMIDCPLEQLDDGRWYCPQCDPDKKRLLPVKARRNCRNTVEIRAAAVELGITTRLIHYAQALARWIAAGRPVRSDAEVAYIHSQHCCACHDDYDPKREVCTVCGCKARREGMAVRNKIKMATESCPRGKW